MRVKAPGLPVNDTALTTLSCGQSPSGSTFLSFRHAAHSRLHTACWVLVGCCWLAVTLWQQAQVQPQGR
jgi:hypothetical protein